MDNYFTFTHLLGLRDQNLPISKETRLKRLNSVKKMIDLLQTAMSLMPSVPLKAFSLNPSEPQWDDMMPFPVVDRNRYFQYALTIGGFLFFYSYNYNIFTQNVRFRTFRNFFPFAIATLFGLAYGDYKKQILKINLFDQYCWLRSQQLVKQNEYLFQHEDFKKLIWWQEDLKQTLQRVHRQANDHQPSDFKDSELILQDFINRYVNPNDKSPMKKFANQIV